MGVINEVVERVGVFGKRIKSNLAVGGLDNIANNVIEKESDSILKTAQTLIEKTGMTPEIEETMNKAGNLKQILNTGGGYSNTLNNYARVQRGLQDSSDVVEATFKEEMGFAGKMAKEYYTGGTKAQNRTRKAVTAAGVVGVGAAVKDVNDGFENQGRLKVPFI